MNEGKFHVNLEQETEQHDCKFGFFLINLNYKIRRRVMNYWENLQFMNEKYLQRQNHKILVFDFNVYFV